MKHVPVKVGEILAGKYRVESVLGAGGMGAVVAATHLELGERRAIKLMLPSTLDEGEAVARFMREARAASRLKSSHVAQVHDVGKLPNGAPYMVMEHLEGMDLRRFAKERGKLPPAEAIRYALQVCEALAEAHAIGIVHRDLKPANLFLTQGTDGYVNVKVLDFGVSKMIGASELEMTSSQTILGSPSYMSPEQMRSSRDVDARTDLWSLGVILYRLIAGELPFKGDNLTEIVALVLQGAPTPPSRLTPGVAPGLDAVILRCLERDRDRRYASVADLAGALAPFGGADARAAASRVVRVLASVSASSIGARPTLACIGTLTPTPTPAGVTTSLDRLDAGPDASLPGAPRSLAGPASSSSPGWETSSDAGETVAVRRWKLWLLMAACGSLAGAFAASVVLRGPVTRPVGAPVASVAQVTQVTQVAPVTQVASGAATVRDSRAEGVVSPSLTAAATAAGATDPPPTPTATPSSVTAVPSKGTRPIVPRTVKVAVATPAVVDPPKPDPAPAPAPLARSAHRVFGSED